MKKYLPLLALLLLVASPARGISDRVVTLGEELNVTSTTTYTAMCLPSKAHSVIIEADIDVDSAGTLDVSIEHSSASGGTFTEIASTSGGQFTQITSGDSFQEWPFPNATINLKKCIRAKVTIGSGQFDVNIKAYYDVHP